MNFKIFSKSKQFLYDHISPNGLIISKHISISNLCITCSLSQMKVLIYDLLCTEVWKQKLYPLLKQQLSQIVSVRSYMTVSLHLFSRSFLIHLSIINQIAYLIADLPHL